MKTFTFFFSAFIFFLFTPFNSDAQTTGHPFEDLVGQEIEMNSIFLLWQQEVPENGLQAFQKVYRYAESPDGDLDQNFDDTPARSDNRTVGGNRHMAVTSGKFAVSLFDHVVAAWEGIDQTIELMIPHFDTTNAMWNDHSSFTVAGPVVPPAGENERGRIFIESGNFNGNELDEFALVYHGADSTIHLEIYDLDGSLNPQLLSSINDEELLPTPIGRAMISVASGDVTGNGKDEIILASVEQLGSQNWAWGIYVKVYELTDSNTLEEVMREIIYYGNQDELNISGMDIAIETGRFRDSLKNDIVLAFTFSTNAFDDDTFIYMLEADQSANTLRFDTEERISSQKSVNRRNIIDLASGDLNQNGVDEFIFALGGSFEIYTVDEMLIPTFRGSGSALDNDNSRLSYNFIDITTMSQDNPEIVIARNIYDQNNSEQWFDLMAFSVHFTGDTFDNLSTKARRLFSEPVTTEGSNGRRYALTTGGFQGYNFYLGEPEHHIDAAKVQPLVILNAPPIHFDIFDDTIFDINRCYNRTTGGDCGFRAIYETSTSEISELTTEIRSDYGFSIGAGISGSLTVAPAGVGASSNFEAYFDKTFGSNFSNIETESEEVTVTFKSEAIEDDRIFASIVDYDVWEYPVFYGAEDHPRRFTLAVVPRNVEKRWFSSKSWNATNYVPNHEVGNILSYPAYADVLDNPDIQQLIYLSDTFGLDANSVNSWEFKKENFETITADTMVKSGYDAKMIQFARVQRDYTGSDISTHSTTIREGIHLGIELGGIDRTYGENRFDVTPYAYWSVDGALVVDYAVAPERSGVGGSSTWWEVRYGELSDPAFILPWRYDPEKGFGIEEEAKRHQTKDIFFNFQQPMPGDTLEITARVRNFSLVSTPSPVSVHFYVGDPDAGGTPIIGVNGEESIETESSIAAQRWMDVTMEWLVPNGLPNNPRIYAVLDQEGSMDEIHLNNNKGFNVLGLSGVGVSNEISAADIHPHTIELHPPYPNPFNPSTTIQYEIGQQGDVVLEVFNVLGQRVEILHHGIQTAGSHHIVWDASNRASGLYFVILRTNQGIQTQKLTLIK